MVNSLTNPLRASKIIIGSTFALPSACLCICIHLEHVASVHRAKSPLSDKRVRQLFELFMCFGLPMCFMGLRMSSFFQTLCHANHFARLYCTRSSIRYYRGVRLSSNNIRLNPCHLSHLGASASVIHDCSWFCMWVFFPCWFFFTNLFQVLLSSISCDVGLHSHVTLIHLGMA